MYSGNKFSWNLSLKFVITTWMFLWLLSILAFSLANPLWGSTYYYDINIDSNVLFNIFFLTCIYCIYKFLKSNSPWYYNIEALYYSIYIATGIFKAFFLIPGYPLILNLAHNFPDASDSFHNTFHDMAYDRITDDMGIILFNNYLYQHLENEPMTFLRNLVSLSEN